jgi:predicted amidohydrolase YtcJ
MTEHRGEADCILLGGTVYTMDPRQPRAQAVAMSAGRIVYVGDASGARALAGPQTETIDLRGRVALPGFIDSHSHLTMFGRYLEQTDCRQARSIEEIITSLKETAARTPPGEWVLGHSYDDTLLTEMRHPTRHDLDRASTEHPILLSHISVHNKVANSAALKMAGVSASTPDPPGGKIDRDEHGEPTGVLWEWAMDLMQPYLPEATADDIRRYLREGATHYLAAGVTSTVEAALGLLNGMEDARAFAQVAESGEVPLRLGAAILYPLWKELQGGAGPGLDWPGDPEWVRPTAVKFFQDGSIQLRTAALREPYHGETGPADHHLIWPQEGLDRMVADAHESGWQIWTHGNGDAAIGSILDAYERALTDNPAEDHRHRIEHCQTAGEDQLDRMGSLGVAASFFAPHVWYWGDRHREVFLGNERAARIDPLASASERSIRFGLHNDTPVTPISPLLSIGTAVSRLTSGGHVLGPEQAITVDCALRSMTLDSAYLAFEENIKGSLTVGKLGDVVILEANPYEVSPQEIKDIPVSLTMIGGNVAYDAS